MAPSKHCVVAFQPLGRRGEVPEGISLLEAARRLGVGLSGVCGGIGVCATCRVIVPPECRDALNPVTPTEEERLSREDLARGVRLACRATIQDSLYVFVPPESLTASQRTQVEGRQTPVRLDPVVRACDLELPPATLSDLRSDGERIRDELGKPVRLDLEVLRSSPLALRDWGWRARAVLREDEIVALLPPGTPLLGVAIDLGTTKLAGDLLNLETGETLAAAGAMNPQLAYGEDVMARITYAMQELEGAQRLRQAAVEGLNGLIRDLCAQAGTFPEWVVDSVVVGNTAMHHLFLGLPTRPLGLAPYVPVESAPMDVRARDAGLILAPGAWVHLLPNIAGFVGADHVAALLAARMDEAAVPTLLLDIGTNTEICLAVEGELFSCSAASGPAFEGAHIRFGMRAAPGAVERVRILEGRVFWETVEGKPPVGICGSGILDAVAELRRAGILNGRGGWRENPSVHRTESGPEFTLVPAEVSGLGRAITISRKDVGEIQLAKGAIAAGWQVLLEEAGIQEEDIGRVVVAGAFGTYIDVRNAVALGLLPRIPLDRFEQVGNIAGTGARMALLSRAERERAARLARRVRYVELTAHPSFRERFARALDLP
ncbi:MAG: ASKHA domain-containing protein [Anaerolineae bacterium]|nr:ASKHA domain-containing protein [Anaerolineae bacterium]